MTVPLISLDDLKAHLPIRAGVTEFDTRLTLLILTATKQIETATDREFDRVARSQTFGTPSTITYGYDFAGTTNETGLLERARPARYTLQTINIDPATLSVYYDPSGVFPESSKLDPTQLSLDTTKGLLTVRASMHRTVDGLRVDYTGGFATGGDGTLSDAIPIDLKMACVSQSLFLHTRMDAMNVGRESEKKEGEGANRFNVRGGLTPEASSLLVRYRALRVSLD